MSDVRRRVALITEHWGDLASEATTITRLLAGALARAAEVEVLHLGAPVRSATTRRDSIFVVHELPASAAMPLRAGLLRVALASRGGGALSPTLERVVNEPLGTVAGVAERLAAIAPDAVVLAGHEQRFDLSAIASGLPVVFLPILGDRGRVREAGIARLVARAERIATVNPGEEATFARAYPARRDDFVALDPALPLNRSATGQLLFGVHWFGTYVLLIRAFPPGTPRYRHIITRELLSSLVGVSAAEVDGERFTVSDQENTVELPVNPTRVNLWRLMAHAEVTIDARPPGPFGQEAIESLLLGTPVVVPAGSAAHAVARASGGGLGYGEIGELVDATRALLAPGASELAGTKGASWAMSAHGDVERFVERAAEIVFGEPAQRVVPSSSMAMPSRMSDSE